MYEEKVAVELSLHILAKHVYWLYNLYFFATSIVAFIFMAVPAP